MNPPGVFNNGIREKDWNIKELPPFSARLMPEFYQRRSIKDMFKKSAAPAASASSSSSLAAATPKPQPEHTTSEIFSASVGSSVVAASSRSIAPSSPEKKRKASEVSAIPTTKKQKPTPPATSKAAPTKGQKSLKGFFQAKPKPEDPAEDTKEDVPVSGKAGVAGDAEEMVGDSTISEATAASSTPHSSSTRDLRSSANLRGSPAAPNAPLKLDDQPPPDYADEMVYDPIVNKESWQSLFRKPAAPLCEGHEEPCKSMQTKKKGENQGRSFWMCARPLGPSGNKEKGTQWRCPTFIWCSDFKAGETR